MLNVSTVPDVAGDAAAHGDADELEYMRRRASRSQNVLLEALRELVPVIPDSYRVPSDVPADRIAQVLALPEDANR